MITRRTISGGYSKGSRRYNSDTHIGEVPGAGSLQELMETAEHPENIEAVINTKSAEVGFEESLKKFKKV